jgi:hypothetical protein
MPNPFKYLKNKIFGPPAPPPSTHLAVLTMMASNGANYATLDNEINQVVLTNHNSRGSRDGGDVLRGKLSQRSIWPAATLKSYLSCLIRDGRLRTQQGNTFNENTVFLGGNVEDEVDNLVNDIQIGQKVILPRGQ